VLNDGSYKGKTRYDLWETFIRTKLSPTTALLVDIGYGDLVNPDERNPEVPFLGELPWEEKAFLTNVVGQDQTPAERAFNMMSPLFIQDMYDIAVNENLGMAFGAAIPGLFGAGATYWTPRNIRNTSTFEGAENILDGIKQEDIKASDFKAEDFDFKAEDLNFDPNVK